MVTALALACSLAFAQESPLIGKPCPKLELSRPVQGMAWSQEELRGRIGVIELFQLGCLTCWSNSLPAAQKLMESYAKDSRVVVVGVATAFEKDQHPEMADLEKIRAELATNHLSFPVMRDREEKSVQLVGLAGKYGTPMTLVLDTTGVVRWHGFNATPETATAVAKMVDELIQTFWVDRIDPLPPELEYYSKGDLPRAAATARGILADTSADPKLRAVAEQVDRNLEAGAKRILDDGLELRRTGFPARAQAKLENAVKVFAVTSAAIEAAKALQVWRDDATFKGEIAAEKQLEIALAPLSKPKHEVAKVVAQLEKLRALHADKPIAGRIQRAIDSLGDAAPK